MAKILWHNRKFDVMSTGCGARESTKWGMIGKKEGPEMLYFTAVVCSRQAML